MATPSFVPVIGGLETLVDNVAHGLGQRGHSVTVVSQAQPTLLEPRMELREDGVTVRRFVRWFGGERFGFSPSLPLWVRRHQHDFDVLHAFNYHAPVALALAVAVEAPLIVTPTYHGEGHTALARLVHIPYGWSARRLIARSSRVVFSTVSERDAFLRAFPTTRASDVVPLATTRDRNDSPEPFDVASPVILFAGRLASYKRVDVLIEAMVRLVSPATLIICGDGPERPRLEQLSTSLRLESKVRFVGHVSDEDLGRWQRTANVVVSLSDHESYGLAVAEGAGAGAQLVISDIPAHREVAAQIGFSPQWVASDAPPDVVAAALDQALEKRRGEGAVSPRSWIDVADDYVIAYRKALLAAVR